MTHTTKHTPGPWVVTEHSAGMICVAGPDHKDLCAVGYNKTEGRDDAANAHLIAAAPVMYADLRIIRDYLYKLYDDGNMQAGEYAASLDTALAQAEGKHD